MDITFKGTLLVKCKINCDIDWIEPTLGTQSVQTVSETSPPPVCNVFFKVAYLMEFEIYPSR